MTYFLAGLLLILSACSTTLKESANQDRNPASEEKFECSILGAQTFNSRRLLALNNVIEMHKKRLEGRTEGTEVPKQLQSLNEIEKRTTYPAIEATWSTQRISNVLAMETDAVINILKQDASGDKKTAENIFYLENKFKPNITSHQYWCPEQFKDNNNSEIKDGFGIH